MSTGKLKKYTADVVWIIALLVVLAQAYRAIAYYIFDRPIDWSYVDMIIAMVAFCAMFVPNDLKTIAVSKLRSMASKSTGK